MNDERRTILLRRVVWLALAAWVCAVLCAGAYLMARYEECLAAGVAGTLALVAWAVRTA